MINKQDVDLLNVSDYLQGCQSDHRSRFVEWAARIQDNFKLAPETLYLSVSLYDRYCSVAEVSNETDQALLGPAVVFLAVRYEEVFEPSLPAIVNFTKNLAHMFGRSFGLGDEVDRWEYKDVLEKANLVWVSLEGKMSSPTCYSFLGHFLDLLKASPLTREMASSYLGKTLFMDLSLCFRASVVAAGVAILAKNVDLHHFLKSCREQEGLVS